MCDFDVKRSGNNDDFAGRLPIHYHPLPWQKASKPKSEDSIRRGAESRRPLG